MAVLFSVISFCPPVSSSSFFSRYPLFTLAGYLHDIPVRFVDPIPPSIRITSPDQSKEALVVSYLVMDYYAYWE